MTQTLSLTPTQLDILASALVNRRSMIHKMMTEVFPKASSPGVHEMYVEELAGVDELETMVTMALGVAMTSLSK